MVAAFGALWGALEITLGSFLHAIKIPFGGTTLAAVAAALLVAQRQLMPQRGLSLATGVVAALCKSVSPGGVILGPMIAITAEALLVELALLAAPRSRISAALAGGLVVCWSTFQKVISHYVYFGGDVIDLYVELLEQASRTVGLTPEAGWRVIGALVVLVAAIGAVIALMGHRVGRRVAERDRTDSPSLPLALRDRGERSAAERPGAPRKRPAPYRWITWLVALGCVALQVGRSVEMAALADVIWLSTVALVDRGALRRLRMPKFWTIMILVALGSGLFLGPRDLDVGPLRLSAQGLEAGALMVLRGVFIFALASWAARNINGRLVRRMASRVGLGNLALAVATAFGVLPALMDRLGWTKRDDRSVWKERLAARRRLAASAVATAEALAHELADELLAGGSRARLVVVQGAPGAGKTTAVERLARALRDRGLAVGGVLQPAVEDDEGRRRGYDVLDLRRGQRRSLARRKAEGRGYDFDGEGWAWAGERLARAQSRDDVVVIDELGRLEARGEGHLPALRALSERPGRAAVLLAAVRADGLGDIVAQLGEPALNLEAPLSGQALGDATQAVETVVREARSKGSSPEE